MAAYSSSIVISLFLLTICGLIFYQNYPERVFGLLFLLLYLLGFVSTEQVVSSLFNQGLMTLILLIFCSLALEKTKILHVICHHIISPKYFSTWLKLYIATVISSAFLNNTAIVSTMITPLRNNPHHPSSKLLLPLSFAAIFGGTLTLVGTSTNLLVNSMVMGSNLPPLHFFDFTVVGITIVFFCGIVLFICTRWLPTYHHRATTVSDYIVEMKVSTHSSLVGKSIEANGLRNLESLFLVEIIRNGRLISPTSPHDVIEGHDRLIFSGDIKKITLLEQFDGLTLFANKKGLPTTNLTEVIIRPESVLRGNSIKDSGFRARFDAAVVGIRRDGTRLSGKLGNVILQSGDYLILAVGEDFKSRNNINKNFYILNEEIKTTHLLKGIKGTLATIGFLVAIGLAALDCVSLFKSMLILLGLFLFSGCLTTNELQQRFPKRIWIIIASALLLSEALKNSGALSVIDHIVNDHQQPFSPIIALIIVYLITWLLTELITNNAAAALTFPIAYSLAISLNVDPLPYILTVAFAASSSFISPYGYQTNLMVYSAGQYKLIDFIRIGLPISITYAICVIGTLSTLYL